MPKTDILGINFDNLTMSEACASALSLALSGKGYIATPNPEIVWLCRKNQAARNAVNRASLVVPDGIGVIYASKILGTPLKERVPGFELAENLLPLFAQNGLRFFLLGAKPGVAEKAAARMIMKHPSLVVCGLHNGYFKNDAMILEAINASRADVVFVCMGAPRQELWMLENLEKTTARLMIGLGGSLDVFAGEIARAPKIWVKLNLEWLYRAIRQPSRFKRLLSLPKFLAAAVAGRLKRG